MTHHLRFVCTLAAGAWALACSDTAGSHADSQLHSGGAGGVAASSAGAGNASDTASTGSDSLVAAGAAGEAGAGGGAASGGSAEISTYAGTSELDVDVPDSGRVYVALAGPSVVLPSTPEDSNKWDLAFEGFNVYTNSGPSGTAQGAAFGQLDVLSLQAETAPTVPFLSPDKAGGAFVDWYAYDGSSHALYSRYHVYGVQSGGQLWKAQVLSYYSEQDNAPVSALYQIRYAALGAQVGETRTSQVDGTAGGLSGGTAAQSGCLDLASGTVTKLTSAEARASKLWDVCFRRDSISVNGEVGGPRGVVAVDLQADKTNLEGLGDVEKETADSALPAFEAATEASFADAKLRGDHVVSAFETGGWLDPESPVKRPVKAAWLVLDAAGKQQFLVAFSPFRNSTASSPGTVVMHVKPVKQ